MSKNLFNSIQLKKPNRNYFDLTHDVKMSYNMGELVPCLTLEVVPGDKIDLSSESIIRFAPLVAPVMHRFDVTTHYFFVPNRILWSNWENYITNSANAGGTGTTYAPPVLALSTTYASGYAENLRFLDYMGIPPISATASGTTNVSALPMAAYLAIYNEYYRDQNLITAIDYQLTDGVNSGTIANFQKWTTLRKRAYMHDYFTASLPFAQKGNAVGIPLGNITANAPIYKDEASPVGTTLTGTPTNVFIPGQNSTTTSTDLFALTTGLTTAPTTINDLRRAFRLQEWLEKNARGGTRYIESILSHFGVRSSDKRLQRPEYICGVKSPVVISEVLNTTGTTGQLPQGNMAGHAISVASGNNGSYNVEEHGYIIGIQSVMPVTAYQQGIPRTYLKDDPLDYYWPAFANIGEQEVQLQELYAYTANRANTFGYVPRYAEYKYMPSRVAGEFRTTLNYWHAGRIFATEPALNQTFIQMDSTSVDRIFAVGSAATQKLYTHHLNKIKAIRPMPKFGTPMM